MRLAPGAIFYLAIAMGLVLAFVTLGLAVEQRWLGLELSASADGQVRIDHSVGPAAAIPAKPGTLVALQGLGGERIELTGVDLVAEPDGLGTYRQMRSFFDRQGAITEILRQPRVMAEVRSASGDAATYPLNPEAQRPIANLPVGFWLQLGVGLAGFWVGAWVWALRPRDWATGHVALAGAGLLMSTFPAAIYSGRELAIDGQLFMVLSGLNSAGALTFGVGMVGLFLLYPARLASPRWLLAPALILWGWLAVDLFGLVEGPALGRHLAIVCAMLAIVVLVLVQAWVTRRNPADRAALAWLGLAVVVGAGMFVATAIVPTILGVERVLPQEQAFLFFLLIYVGIALGVARFQLFQLGEWAFGILFYMVGVLLLIGLDAVLILTIVDDRAPAFALSLLVVGLVWLPLRDTLARLFRRRREIAHGSMFGQVMDVVLSPPASDPAARWRVLLQSLFNPLRIMPIETTRPPVLLENGLAMELPGAGRLQGMRLEYADGGRKLFAARDLDLAAELTAMLESAEQSRIAYERGVHQERERIARDIHDNIGVQLMGALHSSDPARKDALVRETLTDLREIINNASQPDLSLEEMLADLRAQVSEHLFAAGIELDWSVRHEGGAGAPSLPTINATRAIIRESVQNSMKHSGADRVWIAVRQDPHRISIAISDNGRGFDPGAVASGNGLANMRSRVQAAGGELELDTDGATRIAVSFPVPTGKGAS